MKDKQCRFIFTAPLLIFTKGVNIIGGHCICLSFYYYLFIIFIGCSGKRGANNTAGHQLLLNSLETLQRALKGIQYIWL